MSSGRGAAYTPAQLATMVQRLGAQISRDHPDGVIVVGVLKGSFCFVADLIRSLTIDCEVDFLALSPFREGEARVRIIKDIDLDVAGRAIVLVEDVIDTGLSSRYVVNLLESRGAQRVALCALLDRPSRRILPVEIAYLGTEAPGDFLVGYGLDCAEQYRNLPAIHPVNPDELATRRAEFEGRAYGAGGAVTARDDQR